jgi:hypothetical protein
VDGTGLPDAVMGRVAVVGGEAGEDGICDPNIGCSGATGFATEGLVEAFVA